MAQTTITPEVLKARLNQLEELVTEVTKAKDPLADISGRQTSDTWSTVTSGATFSTRLDRAMRDMSTALTTALERMTTMHAELEGYAKDMATQDQGIADQLTRIKNALDGAGSPTAPAAPSAPAPTASW